MKKTTQAQQVGIKLCVNQDFSLFAGKALPDAISSASRYFARKNKNASPTPAYRHTHFVEAPSPNIIPQNKSGSRDFQNGFFS